MTSLADVEALIEREKLVAAREAWRAWQPADAASEWDRERMRIRLCRPTQPTLPLTATTEWHATLDEIAVDSLRLARDPRATGRAGFSMLSNVITIAAVRRLGGRAEELIDEGERRFEMPDFAAGLRGRLYTMLDRREDARTVFEEHLDTSQLDQLHQGYAELLYVVGDFAGTIQQLRRVEGPLYRTEALDLEVQAHAALGDDLAVLDALERALAWSPEGSHSARRLSYRASVRARLDDLNGARADLVSALAHLEHVEFSGTDDGMPLDGLRAYVTKRLESLNSAQESAKRHQLVAFPSVVQKWNYCGPAVLELCLRYVGIGLDQDFIAHAVKKGAGTPMHELVAFLREQGIEARRVEATVDVVKASLDLGYPVILEDDYSATRHVVVAIGYDERLGTLTVADPMNHAPIPRGIELRDRVAREHRFAGVVVMGRAADLTEDHYAAAEQAKLVTPPYLPLLDEAGRSDLTPIQHLSTPNALEIVGLATRVLDQQAAFPAAEAMRIGAASVALAIASPEFVDIATEARRRQPDLAEVPHAISHAARLARHPFEGTGEASRAAHRDPTDPRTWVALGSALSEIGALRDAYAATSRAVIINPGEPGALTSLAYLLTQECARRAVQDSHVKGVARPALMSLVRMFDKSPWQRLDLGNDVLLPLTEQVAYAAAHVDDRMPGGPAAMSMHLWLSGDHDGALVALDEAEQMAPEWTALTVRRLLLAEEQRDLEAMRSIAARVASMGWQEDALWLSTIESLTRAGLYAEARTVAGAAIRAVEQPASLVRAWVDSHCLTSAPERLVTEQVSALATSHVGHDDVLMALASALNSRGLDDVTVEVFGRLVAVASDHLVARHEHARALVRVRAEDSVLADAWSDLADRAPWHTASLVTWAWAAMKSNPRAVLKRLDAVEETVTVLDAKVGAARAAGDTRREVTLMSRLEEILSDPAQAISAVDEHVEAGRFRQAVAINPVPNPPREDLGLLEMWVNGMRRTGRPEYVRDHADVLRPQLDYLSIAVAVALIEDKTSPLAAPSLERLVEFGAPDIAQWARVRLALLRGDARAAARAAAAHMPLLSKVAESTTDVSLRDEIAAQLTKHAPNALSTLCAVNSHALWTGERQNARQAAERLRDEFPADYRAHERMAESAAADGEASTAVDSARRATEMAPQSGRAWDALAWALALNDDWDGAAHAATFALRFPADDARLSPVILAANAQHTEVATDRDNPTNPGLDREIEKLLALSTGGAHGGVIEACRQRAGANPGTY